MKKIAINGFGRIGRLTFRRLLKNDKLQVVAINDLTDIKTLAHLLKYDTAHGKFDGTIEIVDKGLKVNGQTISVTAIRNPEELPWKEKQIDLVLECTGFFRTKEAAEKHLTAGAKDVLISAPAKGGGVQTIVLGVNEKELDRRHNVFSNASCTTNCLAPVAKLLNDNWGINNGSMTTIHAYTSDQKIQDAPHSDLRRSRAAAENIVPTSTGATIAISLVLPELKGKLMGMAVRVPTITGSLIEVNCVVNKKVTVEEINAVFKKAAENELNGILEYCTDPIVSSDIVGNPYSSIFDSLLTKVDGNFVKVVSWYDNEAGYSARLADLCALIVKA